jgi:hypothetical protein
MTRGTEKVILDEEAEKIGRIEDDAPPIPSKIILDEEAEKIGHVEMERED